MRLILCCAALIAGCASTGTQVPEKVLVPVIKPCVTNTPEKPQTTDEKTLLGMDDYAVTLTTWTERLLLKVYAEKAEAVISACR